MSAPVCLDITRLLSRVGTGPHTGIDRVEAAYLRELLAARRDVFGLARTADGFALLDAEGLHRFRQRMTGAREFGAPDVIAMLSRRLSPERRRAEADIRRHAVARVRRYGLGDLVARTFPQGVVYLNVGHSNLDPRVLAAFRGIAGARIGVLIHDTIPLRMPEVQRPASVRRFRDKLGTALAHADTIVFPSKTEAESSRPVLGQFGRVPAIGVVWLGVDPIDETEAEPPLSLPPTPYFVALGTIEPRKNTGLLLDIWEDLGSRAPGLCLIGRRGWCSDDFFARLDASVRRGGKILEFAGLDDAGRNAMLRGSRGLLFPSLAEGFGFPPLEALQAGVPAICSPLGATRELVGDKAVYLDPSDRYLWTQKIMSLASRGGVAGTQEQGRQAGGLQLPSWRTHVCLVLAAVEQSRETLTASF